MTTKDSILALAAKISNGTVPNVATDAQALGELAKAMCGSAPTEPIATVDDAIAYITANYSGGGGGDVSTATVTYTLTGGKSDLFVEGAIAVEEDSVMCSYSSFQTEEASGSFTVLLYGGRASAVIGESIITVVSGDAEADVGVLLITGDCTVTVAPD